MTPLLEGVLGVRNVIDEDETVIAAYRFSELTLVITDRRLVKHVGTVLLDPDYEEFRYEDVTALEFEEGSVAMQIVLTVDGRPERIKAPNDQANEIRLRLQTALQDFYDVNSAEELQAVLEPDETEPEDEEPTEDEEMAFQAGIDPLGPNDASESADSAEREPPVPEPAAETEPPDRTGSTAHADLEEAGFETPDTTATASEDVRAELESLRAAVERQNDLLAQQQETIEQLIDELSRGR
jgi:hypothetical protein